MYIIYTIKSPPIKANTVEQVDASVKDRHGRTALQEAERCNHKRFSKSSQSSKIIIKIITIIIKKSTSKADLVQFHPKLYFCH